MTVTLYVSTGTIYDQGRNVFVCIYTFVVKIELLEQETISSESSTSTIFIQDISNSSIESNMDNSQMSEMKIKRRASISKMTK